MSAEFTLVELQDWLLLYAAYLDTKQGERWRAQLIVLGNLQNFLDGDRKMLDFFQDFIPYTREELMAVAHGADSRRTSSSPSVLRGLQDGSAPK